MAIWQFKVALVPSLFLAGRSVIPEHEWNASEWWLAYPPSTELISQLSHLLPSLESWSVDLEQWGKQDSDLVEVWRENKVVDSISVRFDVRELNLKFIEQILTIAVDHNSQLVCSRYRTVQPKGYHQLVSALIDSPSYKACRDSSWLVKMADEVRKSEKR